MNISKHASERIEQRSIPQVAIDLILDWGKVEHHRGSEVYHLDKKGMTQVKRYLGPLSEGPLAQLKSIYVVVDCGTVITVARKNQHSKRNRH
ncbi:hypothetical protein [Neptunomonas qingdaonensis]|uniref:DUF4258 domain-containing protein n=1 Tax=Neptunomonas qingdaonensis TaxID=1045558 RepID=A0A1I2TTQ0_9GAMM|nr:hypothetical protein [Neptunomonas qingdaonensis]SFG68325.1 hypothetical protein SAMN05216175_11117 [Neptunomonas qingdaonensis]